jgi:hypothetical protein
MYPHGNMNNGQTKNPPPMGRAGSRAANNKQSNRNLNNMFNGNSAVQNIPSTDMNRFRQMQGQMQGQMNPYMQQQPQPGYPPQQPYPMNPVEQQMMMMQQTIQQLQQQLAAGAAPAATAAPAAPAPAATEPAAAAAAPAYTPTPGLLPPPRPPVLTTPAAPSSTSSSADVQQLRAQVAELTQYVKGLEAALLAQKNKIEEVCIGHENVVRYLHDWNAALQGQGIDPPPPSSSSASTGGGVEGGPDSMHDTMDQTLD